MCGITGIWGYRGRDVGRGDFATFTDSLAHRGPDGSGIEHFVADRLWLGHRRLSIIDVSDRGRQPMSYAGGRYWLTYNGEIYNFVELREDLRQRGHRFVSASDSEVILAAYAEWGAGCQLRFNGMWALAIWDDREKTLFLSRDRFAVKPLYYADAPDGSFVFASELKAFLRLGWCDGAFDDAVVAATVRDPSGQESVPETVLPRVKRLLGGHCLTINRDGDRDGRRPERWWDTLEHLPAIPRDLQGQAEQFRDIFLGACRLRLRSDVPIATSLSGGLDSSAVACAVADLGRRQAFDHVPEDWQRAFVACFPGTPLDEQRYASQVVAATGMAPRYHPVDQAGIAQDMDGIVYDLETIFNNPLVGAWAIYREMRRSGIRVSLDGHGADELLGGYHDFVDQAIDGMCGPEFRLRRYLDLKRVRAGLTGGTDIARSGEALDRRGVGADLRMLAKRSAASLGVFEPLRGMARLAGLAAETPVGSILQAPVELSQSDYAAKGRSANGTALHRMQLAWFTSGLLPTFLACIDRASMAHGIEVRMPFLDWRLVTFGFALPDASKIGGGYTKRILRLAMQGLMPDPIRLRRQKVHFSSPIGEWSRGALGPWLLDIAGSQSFLQASSWNGKAARGAIERAVAGTAPIHPVWPAVNAHVLQQRFLVEARTRAPEQAAVKVPSW